MLADQQRTAVIVAIVAIIGLEIWRRGLRNRAPRWVHAVVIGLLASVAAMVSYAWWALGHMIDAVGTTDAGNKATELANGISHYMNANAIAMAGVLVAAIVLAVATWRTRRLPDGGPIAELRSR